MKNRNNILICPLEWGLGHAGRMIPLAKKLLERNNRIFIGAGKEHQALFMNEVPGLEYIDFRGFSPGYSRILPQYIFILFKIPVLLYHIIREHYKVKRIISENKIDIIISDNRLGLWNRRIKSIYVTHQPVIPLPEKLRWLEWAGIIFHRFFISKFSFCLIPDLSGDINLTGRLTHNVRLPGNTRFTGILSRFTDLPVNPGNRFSFPHNTVILSGPEPQRSILREKLVKLLENSDPPTVMLEGKPENPSDSRRTGNIISINHLPSDQMKQLISSSSNIIARPGYSTVMELISLECSALLVPTPGQTEQEYLAAYLSSKGWFGTIPQNKIAGGTDLAAKKATWPQEIAGESRRLLEKTLDEILDQ